MLTQRPVFSIRPITLEPDRTRSPAATPESVPTSTTAPSPSTTSSDRVIDPADFPAEITSSLNDPGNPLLLITFAGIIAYSVSDSAGSTTPAIDRRLSGMFQIAPQPSVLNHQLSQRLQLPRIAGINSRRGRRQSCIVCLFRRCQWSPAWRLKRVITRTAASCHQRQSPRTQSNHRAAQTSQSLSIPRRSAAVTRSESHKHGEGRPEPHSVTNLIDTHQNLLLLPHSIIQTMFPAVQMIQTNHGTSRDGSPR